MTVTLLHNALLSTLGTTDAPERETIDYEWIHNFSSAVDEWASDATDVADRNGAFGATSTTTVTHTANVTLFLSERATSNACFSIQIPAGPVLFAHAMVVLAGTAINVESRAIQSDLTSAMTAGLCTSTSRCLVNLLEVRVVQSRRRQLQTHTSHALVYGVDRDFVTDLMANAGADVQNVQAAVREDRYTGLIIQTLSVVATVCVTTPSATITGDDAASLSAVQSALGQVDTLHVRVSSALGSTALISQSTSSLIEHASPPPPSPKPSLMQHAPPSPLYSMNTSDMFDLVEGGRSDESLIIGIACGVGGTLCFLGLLCIALRYRRQVRDKRGLATISPVVLVNGSLSDPWHIGFSSISLGASPKATKSHIVLRDEDSLVSTAYRSAEQGTRPSPEPPLYRPSDATAASQRWLSAEVDVSNARDEGMGLQNTRTREAFNESAGSV